MLAYGGAGLLGVLLVAGAVNNSGPGKRPVSPKPNELDTWTKKYNRKSGKGYGTLPGIFPKNCLQGGGH